MSERPDLTLFLDHWQNMTGLIVNEVLEGRTLSAAPGPDPEPFYPKSFFDASRTNRGLPFTKKSLRKPDYTAYLGSVRASLPANPGDLLWLMHQFLSEHYPNGGNIDLASGTEHRDSVYKSLTTFCAKATYKHHPHLQTLKAFVSIVEQGASERLIATNAFCFALEVLRDGFSKKSKTLILKVDGQRKDSTRFVAEVGRNTPSGAVRSWDEPDLECEIEDIGDLTDDEQEESHEMDYNDDGYHDEDLGDMVDDDDVEMLM
jgi:hypothetical protein